MPKVSVIVPNYNHAPFLRQRIDSILNQTFQDFELILLDDASTDDSRSILSSYSANPHVAAVHFNEKNSGSTFKQWNKGVRLARGEYIWIAESDDYADPHFLERLISVLDTKPQVVFVSCRSWQVDTGDHLNGYADWYLESVDPNKWTNDFTANGRDVCSNYFVRFCPIHNASSVLFRKTLYERVGGSDETLRFCGDWKLWAAMALEGDIAHVREPLNYYRTHGSNISERSKREGFAAVEYLRVIRWILSRVKPTAATLQKLREVLPKIWMPPITSGNVPFGRRCRILRDATLIDPYTLRKAVSPISTAIRIKLSQRYRFARQRNNRP